MALFLCLGCDETATENSPDGYIGGRIVNATSNSVVLLKDNVPLDTVLLDERNNFGYRVKNAEPGLYLLKHSPESQVLHLEPGDSILLRANSLDFDQSLQFSGKGGEKNNFLSDIDLMNAGLTNLVLSYYKLDPVEFAARADSVKAQRLDLLARRNEKYGFSDDFMELASRSIEYGNYDLRERYTYMVNKYYKEHSRQLPADFHNYRKSVNFNEKALQTCPSYIRFIENYLINEAMKECARANVDNHDCYDVYDHLNITSRINSIDSLTSLPLVKNHFFSKLSVLGTIMARERAEIVNVFELMQEKGYSEEQLERLTNVGRVQLAYLPGMNIGKLNLLNIKGEKVLYEEVTDKPAVVFLWSIYSPANHQQNHNTIKSLRKKYPEIAFLGINVNPGETAEWAETVGKYGYDPNYEYQLTSSRIDKESFQYYLNKVLLLDASSVVYKGDAYINSPQFETKILELLNQ